LVMASGSPIGVPDPNPVDRAKLDLWGDRSALRVDAHRDSFGS
jgi:hypothetical protein